MVIGVPSVHVDAETPKFPFKPSCACIRKFCKGQMICALPRAWSTMAFVQAGSQRSVDRHTKMVCIRTSSSVAFEARY